MLKCFSGMDFGCTGIPLSQAKLEMPHINLTNVTLPVPGLLYLIVSAFLLLDIYFSIEIQQ